MADISAEIAAFQNAVYGEEVRGSMISAIEKINDVTEGVEDTVDAFSDGFQNAVSACDTAAESANSAASSANAAAATADTATEAATNAAESATSAASNATAQANAASQLNTTVQQAEAARRTAESARVTAENSRVAAETARAGSESNRNNAETTRQENESNRNTAEVSRINAEATRQAQETSRQNAESSRTTAEQNRASTFSAMQQSFSEMAQQVLPPATYSTLGGVIIDSSSGLQVASDGTLSFTAGDFLTASEAAATYATITTVDGKANAQHNHSATDINNGTLAVARGGTGVTTAAAERERLGLGSTTDALPVANGGTGATTATGALANLGAYSATEVDTALAGYLPLSGGFMNGGVVIKDAEFDRNGANPSSIVFGQRMFSYRDKDGDVIGFVQPLRDTDGKIGIALTAANGDSSNNSVYANFRIFVDKAGNATYTVGSPGNFRTAIGASSGIWPVSLGGTGATTAANARTNLGLGETTYSGSGAITAASGYSLETNTSATKRAGVVATNIGIKTTAAYTAGTLVKVGTLVSALKPKSLTPFIMWQTAWSVGYIENDGSVYVRLGANISANGLLGWVRLTYMASTI